MIERWLQITCDVCGETTNSELPDMSVAEFRVSLRPVWFRFNGKDLCKRCHDRAKAKP